jgi:hypothetical protein
MQDTRCRIQDARFKMQEVELRWIGVNSAPILRGCKWELCDHPAKRGWSGAPLSDLSLVEKVGQETVVRYARLQDLTHMD